MAIVNIEDYYFIYGGGDVEPLPTTRWVPSFNGTSTYLNVGEVTYSGDFYIEFEVITTQTGSDWAFSDTADFAKVGGDSLIYMDNPDGLQILIPYANGNFYRYYFQGQSEICDGNRHKVRLERGGTTMNLWIDNTLFSTVVDTVVSDVKLSTRLFGGSSRYLNGIAFNIDLNGELISADQPFSEYPDLGLATAVNFTENDVVEIDI